MQCFCTHDAMFLITMLVFVVADKKRLLGCTRNNCLAIVDLASGNIKASLRLVYSLKLNPLTPTVAILVQL